MFWVEVKEILSGNIPPVTFSGVFFYLSDDYFHVSVGFYEM